MKKDIARISLFPDLFNRRARMAVLAVLALLAGLSWAPFAVAGHSINDEEVPESVKAKGEEAVREWLEKEYAQSNALKKRVALRRAETRKESIRDFHEDLQAKANELRQERRERQEKARRAEIETQRQGSFLLFGGFILAVAGAGCWAFMRSASQAKASGVIFREVTATELKRAEKLEQIQKEKTKSSASSAEAASDKLLAEKSAPEALEALAAADPQAEFPVATASQAEIAIPALPLNTQAVNISALILSAKPASEENAKPAPAAEPKLKQVQPAKKSVGNPSALSASAEFAASADSTPQAEFPLATNSQAEIALSAEPLSDLPLDLNPLPAPPAPPAPASPDKAKPSASVAKLKPPPPVPAAKKSVGKPLIPAAPALSNAGAVDSSMSPADFLGTTHDSLAGAALSAAPLPNLPLVLEPSPASPASPSPAEAQPGASPKPSKPKPGKPKPSKPVPQAARPDSAPAAAPAASPAPASAADSTPQAEFPLEADSAAAFPPLE
jgi:hypothetical protein